MFEMIKNQQSGLRRCLSAFLAFVLLFTSFAPVGAVTAFTHGGGIDELLNEESVEETTEVNYGYEVDGLELMVDLVPLAATNGGGLNHLYGTGLGAPTLVRDSASALGANVASNLTEVQAIAGNQTDVRLVAYVGEAFAGGSTGTAVFLELSNDQAVGVWTRNHANNNVDRLAVGMASRTNFTNNIDNNRGASIGEGVGGIFWSTSSSTAANIDTFAGFTRTAVNTTPLRYTIDVNISPDGSGRVAVGFGAATPRYATLPAGTFPAGTHVTGFHVIQNQPITISAWGIYEIPSLDGDMGGTEPGDNGNGDEPVEPETAPKIAPEVRAGIGASGTVTLSWGAVSGATEYVINGGGLVDYVTTELSRTVTGLTDDIPYTFTIFARNTYGDGPVGTITATPVDMPLTATGGAWLESAYAYWTGVPGASYNIYVRENDGAWSWVNNPAQPVVGQSTWTNDHSPLARVVNPITNQWRVDVPGLRAGVAHEIRIVEDGSGREVVLTGLTPEAFDRQGFAFDPTSPWGTTTGAHNADGTLRNDAIVIYVTAENVNNFTTPWGTTGIGGAAGLFHENNARNRTGANAGRMIDAVPVAIRFIGTVPTPATVRTGNMIRVGRSANFTFEGVGHDARLLRWGLNINSSNVIIRNLTFEGYPDDAINLEGWGGTTGQWPTIGNGLLAPESGTGNRVSTNIWITQNTFIDNNSGDGAIDASNHSSYFTMSWNRVYDGGRLTNLGSTQNNIRFRASVHNNFVSNNESRVPRVRWGQVHFYNNVIDGANIYAIGAGHHASVIAEGNYFVRANRPMIISNQGASLDGGSNTLTGDYPGYLITTLTGPTIHAGNPRGTNAIFNLAASLMPNEFANITTFNPTLDQGLPAPTNPRNAQPFQYFNPSAMTMPVNVTTARVALDTVPINAGAMPIVERPASIIPNVPITAPTPTLPIARLDNGVIRIEWMPVVGVERFYIRHNGVVVGNVSGTQNYFEFSLPSAAGGLTRITSFVNEYHLFQIQSRNENGLSAWSAEITIEGFDFPVVDIENDLGTTVPEQGGPTNGGGLNHLYGTGLGAPVLNRTAGLSQGANIAANLTEVQAITGEQTDIRLVAYVGGQGFTTANVGSIFLQLSNGQAIGVIHRNHAENDLDRLSVGLAPRGHFTQNVNDARLEEIGTGNGGIFSSRHDTLPTATGNAAQIDAFGGFGRTGFNTTAIRYTIDVNIASDGGGRITVGFGAAEPRYVEIPAGTFPAGTRITGFHAHQNTPMKITAWGIYEIANLDGDVASQTDTFVVPYIIAAESISGDTPINGYWTNGFFTAVGTDNNGRWRAGQGGGVFETGQNGAGHVEFTTTGVSTVTFYASSTGGGNWSALTLWNGASEAQVEVTGRHTVVDGGNTGTNFTFENLPAGTWRVVSNGAQYIALDTNSPAVTAPANVNRGARIHRITVTQTFGELPTMNQAEYPTSLVATSNLDGRVPLTWSHVVNATRHEFRYRPVGGVWSNWATTSARDSHTVTGLTNGTTFEFQVRGHDGTNASELSAIITATPVSLPLLQITGISAGATHSFGEVAHDFTVSDFTPLSITITNNGTAPALNTVVTLGGTSFVLTGDTEQSSLASGASMVFEVAPRLLLVAGLHTDVVTISANGLANTTFNVNFNVTPQAINAEWEIGRASCRERV